MTRIIHRLIASAICAGAFTGAASGQATAPDDGMRRIYRSYEVCMGNQVAHFARKAQSADEAIAGARASCVDERKELHESIVVKSLVDAAERPNRPFSERASEDHADRVLVRLDERMRDALTKRYLDSK